jgi:hypothetical protein
LVEGQFILTGICEFDSSRIREIPTIPPGRFQKTVVRKAAPVRADLPRERKSHSLFFG